MAFWGIAAVVVLGALALVFAPLIRGRGRVARRASYDMQVYRDQLKSLDADRARGVLSDAEAEATRLEISRKLLAAADAEAGEPTAGAAPRRVSLILAPVLVLALAVAAGGLYRLVGAPGLPDLPREARLARIDAEYAGRPSQAEAEAMFAPRAAADADGVAAPGAELVERLQTVLAREQDPARAIEGTRLLVTSLAALGRYSEAHAAQARVIDLLGDAATPGDRVDLAELMILAAGGFVSPEAEAQVRLALTDAPEHRRGRYFSGLALDQAGRADLAYPIWSRLLAEGPPDAPWIPAINAQIGRVAERAGRAPPPSAAAPPRGPSQADIAAATDMTDEDRAVMIAGMVDALGSRLAAEGGPPGDWARLIRALGVLERQDEAAEIWAEAQGVFADDPGGLAAVRGAAQDAGVAE